MISSEYKSQPSKTRQLQLPQTTELLAGRVNNKQKEKAIFKPGEHIC